MHGSAKHTDIMKTEGLKQALDKYSFDAAFGGARRDEEKSRAKERIYSFRDRSHRWDPKTNGLSYGITTMGRSIKEKVFVFSHYQIGLNSISGNISIWKISTLFPCTLQRTTSYSAGWDFINGR